MAIRDNIKNLFNGIPKTQSKAMGNMVSYFGVNTSGKQYDYKDLAEEGYMKNSIVYRTYGI